MKYFIIIGCLITLLASCQPKGNTPTEDQEQATEHDHEHPGVSVLIFSDQLELFAECETFFEGHSSEIRAHLTTLDPLKPIAGGSLSVRWQQKNKFSDWISLKADEPGIYTGNLPVASAGEMNLEFRLQLKGQEIRFQGKDYLVLNHDQEPLEPEHQEGANFTLEQAWKTEFSLMKIRPQTYREPLHCSGKIVLPPDKKFEIIAPAGGQVVFVRNHWSEGSWIQKGEQLFTLLPVGFGDDQFQLEWKTTQARFVQAQANYQRKKELVKSQAVSEQEFESAKAAFVIAEAKYKLLKNQISDSGISIISPVSGYVDNLNCHPDVFVDKGASMISLMIQGSVWLQADVPVNQAVKLSQVKSAQFKIPGDPVIHQLDSLEGKPVSFGKKLHNNSGFIPLFFDISSTDYLPGSYAEIWLLSGELSDQIIIPKTSLMEEYGLHYVYVLNDGESYEKRLVHISSDDGIQIRIESGLSVGEIIVSRGAMAIKVANTIGSPPAHTHNH